MSLDNGGHLTHGSPENFSASCTTSMPIGLGEDERIDYDVIERMAKELHPKLIVGGASAYPRVIDFERMARIAHDNGALFMVDMAHIAGLVATGAHPSPVPYADIVTTTTHKTLRGRAAASFHQRRGSREENQLGGVPGQPGRPLMPT